MSDTPPITQVTGGADGLAATYGHVRALADTYQRAGGTMREWAAADGRVLVDRDLVESAVLSPLTFAEAEAAVVAAATGPHGILVESVAYDADAVLVRVTVWAFEECDRLVHDSWEMLDYLVGRTIGFGLATAAPFVLAAGVIAGPELYVIWQHLPPGLQQQIQADGVAAADALQEWLDEHPETVQHLVNGGGGLLDGLTGGVASYVPGALGLGTFDPTTNDAAATLAALYGDEGAPHVHPEPGLTTGLAGVQPGSLHDVMEHLSQTNDLPDGTIEIQTITDPDGSVRYVVYLPGTDDMTTTPWSQDGDVRDMATNLNLVAGHDTTYEQGIRQAMHDAGIGPDDPVLLAGHSQGGMEAAAMLSHGSGFNVTHVITAGSPTAQVDGFPPGTHVLSFENQGDVVPLLDGEDNPDSVQQTTVRFDDHETSIGANHGLQHYVHGADAADASTDPSITEQVQSLQSSGFLGTSAGASSQVFQITR